MAEPNATLVKFGYPATCLEETEHWVVLLRPAQATLGALIVACKEHVTRYSDLSDAAFAESGTVVRTVERALHAAFSPEKLNWMMLMMVDPHVHYHVLPRYSQPRTFAGHEFADPGWPGPPALGAGEVADDPLRNALMTHLAEHGLR